MAKRRKADCSLLYHPETPQRLNRPVRGHGRTCVFLPRERAWAALSRTPGALLLGLGGLCARVCCGPWVQRAWPGPLLPPPRCSLRLSPELTSRLWGGSSWPLFSFCGGRQPSALVARGRTAVFTPSSL